jgi:hypothetical protein
LLRKKKHNLRCNCAAQGRRTFDNERARFRRKIRVLLITTNARSACNAVGAFCSAFISQTLRNFAQFICVEMPQQYVLVFESLHALKRGSCGIFVYSRQEKSSEIKRSEIIFLLGRA